MEQLAGMNRYFPDLLYTLDVAFTNDDVYVIEINSFVSSGLYEIDFQQLVPKIESVLLRFRHPSSDH
jgi:glutathione synthase/RimK-type ligase-like ATP-grasp enzyme